MRWINRLWRYLRYRQIEYRCPECGEGQDYWVPSLRRSRPKPQPTLYCQECLHQLWQEDLRHSSSPSEPPSMLLGAPEPDHPDWL